MTEHRAEVLRCARAAGIDESRLEDQVESWSNHTVMVAPGPDDDGRPQPASVLRVCWIGNTDRLLAEAALMRELPADLGCPRIIASGREGELTWALAERLTGCTLAEAWPDLDATARAEAARATADLLTGLYAHRPSREVTEMLLALPTGDDLIGSAILAWPTSRLRRLLDDPRCVLRDDQKRTISDLVARNQSLVPTVDRADLPVIHGDLHASNLWWNGERVSGLLDLEWARLAEPWTDLGRTRERAMADAACGEGPHVEFVDAVQSHLPAWQIDAAREAMSTLGYLVRESLLWQPLDSYSADDPAPADHVVTLTDQVLASPGLAHLR